MIRICGIIFVFFNVVIVVKTNVISDRNINDGKHNILPPMLPDTYKDIFVGNSNGKITLGTTKATCWARGGICVDIRECPHLRFDISVPGCAWGYKVCCKEHRFLPPTVGQHRKSRIPHTIDKLEDLGGVSLENLAERNTRLLKSVLEFEI